MFCIVFHKDIDVRSFDSLGLRGLAFTDCTCSLVCHGCSIRQGSGEFGGHVYPMGSLSCSSGYSRAGFVMFQGSLVCSGATGHDGVPGSKVSQ